MYREGGARPREELNGLGSNGGDQTFAATELTKQSAVFSDSHCRVTFDATLETISVRLWMISWFSLMMPVDGSELGYSFSTPHHSALVNLPAFTPTAYDVLKKWD